MNAQGTDEWLAERLGCASASRFSDIIAKTKSGPSTSRRNYMVELAAERLTGQPTWHFTNAAMKWGTDHEAPACGAYEWLLDCQLQESPFVRHTQIDWLGCSPDRLAGSAGLVEVKCPAVSAGHIETVLAGGIPAQHKAQVQGQLLVTGREWCDFVSFDPRMPKHLRLYVYRVGRDEQYIDTELLPAIETFLAETAALVDRLMSYEVAA